MFIAIAYPKKSPQEVNQIARDTIPWYIFLPFHYSTKYLGLGSFGEFSTSKRILKEGKAIRLSDFDVGKVFQKRFKFIGEPKGVKDAVRIILSAAPFMISFMVFLSLFNWVQFYLLPDAIEDKDLADLMEIEKEFNRVSKIYFFTKIVRRRTRLEFSNRKLILETYQNLNSKIEIGNVGNTKNYVVYNHNVTVFNFPEIRYINPIRLIEIKKPIRLINHNGSEAKVRRFVYCLVKINLILKEDVDLLYSFFFPSEFFELDRDFYPVQWLGTNRQVYYLFECLLHFNVISIDEMTSILPKLEANFYNKKGEYLKNMKNVRKDLAGMNAFERATYSSAEYFNLYCVAKECFDFEAH